MARTWEHLKEFQKLPKIPADPNEAWPDWYKMSETELRKQVTKQVKRINERLRVMERKGQTKEQAYKAIERKLTKNTYYDGRAPYAGAKGVRYKESLGKMSAKELITIMRETSFDLRRATTMHQIEVRNTKQEIGMETALDMSKFGVSPEVRAIFDAIIGDKEMMKTLFESESYKAHEKSIGYRSVLRTELKRVDRTITTILHKRSSTRFAQIYEDSGHDIALAMQNPEFREILTKMLSL